MKNGQTEPKKLLHLLRRVARPLDIGVLGSALKHWGLTQMMDQGRWAVEMKNGTAQPIG